MACNHDLAEMDTAAHWDGICPLCMKAEVERLRAENENLRRGKALDKPLTAALEIANSHVRAALPKEREAIATEARRYASHYPEASDGRNTFILLAEWIERRGVEQTREQSDG